MSKLKIGTSKGNCLSWNNEFSLDVNTLMTTIDNVVHIADKMKVHYKHNLKVYGK